MFIRQVNFIKLIIYLPNNFFKNIFHSYKSRGTAIFIDNDGKMHFLFLEFLQQVLYQFLFMHKIRLPGKLLPFKIIAFVEMWQYIFCVDNARYLIQVFFIGRHGLPLPLRRRSHPAGLPAQAVPVQAAPRMMGSEKPWPTRRSI